jgi:hypothetical protein
MGPSGRDAAGGAVTSIPTLAEIGADRARLAGLPFETLLALLLDVGQLEREITVALVGAMARGTKGAPPTEDRLLTTEEAAAKFQVSPHTMKRWARVQPYTQAVVVLGRTTIRWNAQRLDDVLRTLGAQRPRRKAATL